MIWDPGSDIFEINILGELFIIDEMEVVEIPFWCLGVINDAIEGGWEWEGLIVNAET